MTRLQYGLSAPAENKAEKQPQGGTLRTRDGEGEPSPGNILELFQPVLRFRGQLQRKERRAEIREKGHRSILMLVRNLHNL